MENNQKGISLVGVMVAVGLIGIVALVLSSMFKGMTENLKSLRDKSDVEDLKRYIRFGMNCTKTYEAMPHPCNANAIIAVKRRLGTNLVEPYSQSNHTKLDKYIIKAQCTGSRDEFQIYKSINGSSWSPIFQLPLNCPPP